MPTAKPAKPAKRGRRRKPKPGPTTTYTDKVASATLHRADLPPTPLDPYEPTKDPRETRPTGRPDCIAAGVFTLAELRAWYSMVRSIRKTAEHFKVSPTTVKKHLSGEVGKRGRPVQPKSWEVACRSPLHKWFTDHRDRHLPRDVKDLALMSGFSTRRISRYLNERRLAMLAFLETLPAPNSVVIVFRDVEGSKVPSNLLRAYTVDVDRFSGAVSLSGVLSPGGMRIIRVPFREYVAALRGENPELPVIGLVRPVPGSVRYRDPWTPVTKAP